MTSHNEKFLVILNNFTPTMRRSVSLYLFVYIIIQVYWIGPALGGIIAAMSYDWIMDPNSNWDRVKKCATCEYGETENDEENHVTVLEPLPGNSARNG